MSYFCVVSQCLSNLSVEPRPEVRTSAVRTLFMAMGSHCCKFGPADLRECLTGMMLPLIQACHKGAHTSSNTILRPQELGKDKGKAVLQPSFHVHAYFYLPQHLMVDAWD